MDFGSLIRLGKKADREFDELQSDMAHALEESMVDMDDPLLSDDPELDDDRLSEDETNDRPLVSSGSIEPDARDIAGDEKLTPHTRGRLEALKGFEGLYQGAQGNLQDVGARLLEMRTLLVSVGELVNILNAEIHRGNDLELANTRLLSEHRKLWEQLQDSTRKHQERETLLERLQQRETMLFQENEALRSSLATAKLDVVEASNANARNEAELNELSKTVETRNAEIERHSRENEALREKNTALSIENDKIAKREAEARHRLEENAQIHEKEAARNSELLNALAASEKETLRLQKALDRAIATQAELKERAAVIETEREADMQRAQVESRGLRSEIQNLQTRLEAVLQEQSAAIAEKANVKERLKDALAEKYVLEERLSALVKESEADRVNLSRLSANLSELTLRQASEQIQLDVRIQECEDLRGEIAALNAQIKELLPYERLHRVTQARQREAAGSVVDFDTAAADTKRGNRRPHGHGRRHV